MKRIVLLFSFVLLPCLVHAGMGTQPDYDEKVWKSSFTGAGQLFNSEFASAPIVINQIKISSPTVNVGGPNYVRVMVSTVSTYGTWVSTLCGRVTNSAGNAGEDGRWNVESNIKQSTSTYSFLDKRGAAEVFILWDWLDSSQTAIKPSLE